MNLDFNKELDTVGIRKSKSYGKDISIFFFVITTILLALEVYNLIYRPENVQNTDFLFILVSLILALALRIPPSDKVVLTISKMGIETKSQYLSWRDVENMYIETFPTDLTRKVVLKVKKKDLEHVAFELTELEGSPEEIAQLLGQFYSIFVSKQGK